MAYENCINMFCLEQLLGHYNELKFKVLLWTFWIHFVIELLIGIKDFLKMSV